jgi:hypothetical protein
MLVRSTAFGEEVGAYVIKLYEEELSALVKSLVRYLYARGDEFEIMSILLTTEERKYLKILELFKKHSKPLLKL